MASVITDAGEGRSLAMFDRRNEGWSGVGSDDELHRDER